jgi:hypothetical protein
MYTIETEVDILNTPIPKLKALLLNINHPKRIDYENTIHDDILYKCDGYSIRVKLILDDLNTVWVNRIKVYYSGSTLKIYYNTNVYDGVWNFNDKSFTDEEIIQYRDCPIRELL